MSKKKSSQTISLATKINSLLALLIILVIISAFVEYGLDNKSLSDIKEYIGNNIFGQTGEKTTNKTEGDTKEQEKDPKTIEKDTQLSSSFLTETTLESANSDSGSENKKGLKLQPKPTKSSPELEPLVKQFSEWMEFQHRRAGFKLFQKAYAKRQKHACILYLQATEGFLQQPKGKKSQTITGLWEYWSQHAVADELVNTPKHTYVIVLDKNYNAVVGSKYKNPEEVWFSK